MNNSQLTVLIGAIFLVGLGLLFGPRFLDDRQKDRDRSPECGMYRSWLDLSRKARIQGISSSANESYEYALENFRKGKCTRLH